jgi:hypothetical protein
MDFTGVKAITMPEGVVKKITNASGEVLWEKPSSGTPPTLYVEGIVDGYATMPNTQVNSSHTKPHNVYVYKDGVLKQTRTATASGDVYKTRFGIGWLGNGSYEIVATDEDGNTSRETFIDNI